MLCKAKPQLCLVSLTLQKSYVFRQTEDEIYRFSTTEIYVLKRISYAGQTNTTVTLHLRPHPAKKEMKHCCSPSV